MFTALGHGHRLGLQDMQGFQLMMNFLVMPIFFLSGALFPLTIFRKLSAFCRLDPLSYGVDGLRDSLVGSAHFGAATDLAVLGVLCTLFLMVGGRLFSRIQL